MLAVLTAHHDKCGYDLNVHVIVPEQKSASLMLDTEYLEILIGDQGGEINLKVTGGGNLTANNVTWSATKSGGGGLMLCPSQSQVRRAISCPLQLAVLLFVRNCLMAVMQTA